MKHSYLNEFNSIGAPSEAVKRKLLYLAEIGSEAVTSGYRANPYSPDARQQDKQDATDAQFHALANLVMASQERIAEFRERLDLFDQASLAALRENEEKLREAEQALQDIREQVYEITQPDGTVVKLYRDEQSVRREDGAVIDPAVVRAEDVSQNPAQWSERRDASLRVDELKQDHLEIMRYRDRLNSAGKHIDGGDVSESELDELEAGLKDTMPEAVRRQYEGPPLPVQDREAGTAKTSRDGEPALSTDIRPAATFKAAVSPVPAPRISDDNSPSGPHGETPAPM